MFKQTVFIVATERTHDRTKDAAADIWAMAREYLEGKSHKKKSDDDDDEQLSPVMEEPDIETEEDLMKIIGEVLHSTWWNGRKYRSGKSKEEARLKKQFEEEQAVIAQQELERKMYNDFLPCA